MKVAVIGSRGISNIDISKYIPENTSSIISGGAKGIDSIAEQYANENHIDITVIKPNYEMFGKMAPLVRDRQIVEAADLIIAIWDGKSNGTKYTLREAMKLGKPVKIYTINQTNPDNKR